MSNFFFSHNVCKSCLLLMCHNEYLWSEGLNMKMAESFLKRVENTVGKGEIAHYMQFLLFPRCFQKTCAADT